MKWSSASFLQDVPPAEWFKEGWKSSSAEKMYESESSDMF